MDEKEEEPYDDKKLYQKMRKKELEEEIGRELRNKLRRFRGFEDDWNGILNGEQHQERARWYIGFL